MLVLSKGELAMYKIAIIAGSLSKESINKKLALALTKAGSEIFEFNIIDISQIPLYNGDVEDSAYPPAVQRMKDEVAACDAVIFVTPEYNRSIPGVLKNVLDWGSRPMNASAWAGKPAAMTGASPGAIGTAVAQSHLRSVLGFLGMRLAVQPELYFQYRAGLIADDGSVSDANTLKYLQRFLSSFKAWIDELKG